VLTFGLGLGVEGCQPYEGMPLYFGLVLKGWQPYGNLFNGLLISSSVFEGWQPYEAMPLYWKVSNLKKA